MATIDHCRLLCASASAYLIDSELEDGIHHMSLKPTPTPKNQDVIRQFEAIKLIHEKQYVVVASPFLPNKFLKIEACFIGETEEGIIISFRGTLPFKVENAQMIADWIENVLYATPRPYLKNAQAKVHEGFLDAVQKLETGIVFALSKLNKDNTKPIYLTGHSKGGAMAPIAAMIFKRKNIFTANHVVTFAGPKPGDKLFADAYNAQFPESTNYENYLDIVPFMPPSTHTIDLLIKHIPKTWTYIQDILKKAEKWNYTPVSKVLYIKEDCSIIENPGDIINDIRLFDIGKTLASHPELVGDAHHVTCGYRYMKAICQGNVCKT